MRRVRKPSLAWLACVVAMIPAVACAPDPPPDLAPVASRYIQLTLGLARHDPSLVDHWLITAPDSPPRREPVVTLRAEVDRLAADLAVVLPRTQGDDRQRAAHLEGQIRALQLVARRLMGESLPFTAEARLGLGIEPTRPNLVAIERARAALDAELPGPGPLAERVTRFRASFIVPPPNRDATMRAALTACREATRAAGLPLPDDEAIELAWADGLPWDAHARYLGGHRTRITVNASQPLDLARALRLACHEGYPGHHAQYIWTADAPVAGRGWTELALVPGFGPDLLIAEGAAEAGADLALPPDERPAVYRDALAPAAGLTGLTDDDLQRLARIEALLADIEPVIGDIAGAYLDNRTTAAAAAQRLADEALLVDPDAFVAFIERRRTRLLAYSEGRRLVHDAISRHGIGYLHGLFTSRVLTVDQTEVPASRTRRESPNHPITQSPNPNHSMNNPPILQSPMNRQSPITNHQ